MAAASVSLSDDEGTFLALLVRVQPATAYQISKIYSESPVSNFGTSKGKIYPLIRRLKARGLLSSTIVQGDARGTEQLVCTRKGEASVRSWVKDVKEAHLLLEDPLRTKVQSFDLLTPSERLEWLKMMRAQLAEKLRQLERYSKDVTVPFHELVHDNAVTSIKARIGWLERAERAIRKADSRRR